MSKPLVRNITLVLGAAALFSLRAQAAAPAGDNVDPWPSEMPAQVFFVDTQEALDGAAVRATASVRVSGDDHGPVATAPAPRDSGAAASGMH